MKVFANLVIVAFVFAQLFVTFTRTHFYPFSYFGLYASYATPLSAENFHSVQFMLLAPDGTEHPFRLHAYGYKLPVYQDAVEGLPHSEPERSESLAAVARDLILDYRFYRETNPEIESPRFKALRIYVYEWKLFTPTKRTEPDSRRLMFEAPIP